MHNGEVCTGLVAMAALKSGITLRQTSSWRTDNIRAESANTSSESNSSVTPDGQC